MNTLTATAYPQSPGWKTETPETSKAAALAVKGRAATLREQCHAALKGAALTADEVAELVGESVLSVRPRITELFKAGRVRQKAGPDGRPLRRANASGASAAVWEAVPVAPPSWRQEALL